MNKTQTLFRNVLLFKTAQPLGDAMEIVPTVVRKGKADASVAALSQRDYRPIPFMPKGSKNGDYAVPAEFQPVIGGALLNVRWTSYRGSRPYPMFTLDGTKIRKKGDDGEHTEEYRVIRQAFAAGIIPLPEATEPVESTDSL